ncbi:SDR family NAD(P)-dependent oxidoreductase [Erwiniaceae bacterium BAC15a-03b]|uniref:SDR family NAD(P)-dependent oxidoreductase n=1 Tax=Winslowiella arboricola TaxID=2978220 RepID=A0A9J6Q069_9GAMM|nr:SDR family NAD(P)-dependent oxidoreductase [Winslowiella arboricola]MCU5775503.1 SDR family NAD(P)-dependent oxidoreductase [Winslowiella arboricola]MCU5779647.1 SDR family NAD(P)-dependent oxidoreductase [Winslowiella arboricola]
MNPLDSEQFTRQYGDTLPIAIIGAGCRFPRAASVFEFWRRIADGEELTSRFDAEALQRAGVDAALLQRADYVPAAAVVEDADRFEWGFFGYSRQEAESIDPQQRLFLMCAWEALEMAGYPPATLSARTGVIGSTRMSTYQLAQRQDAQQIVSPQVFQKLMGNDKDYLATRVAYKLGLRGPAYTVQTACSSSLIATHLACEAIASGDAEMMLAGGASLSFPQQAGYFYREGMIFSADGHCRPFDADANGTLVGNGVAVVLLKRLDRALEAGDPILSVIRGTAINNDGNDKAGFTAPSLSGQRDVIRDALAMADVAADTIGLVEAHGTATPLGDPLEISALTEAWSPWTPQPQQAAIGSLKSNVGHLDTAAGIASLLKAGLATWQRQIPPSINFSRPNPAINFAGSPFYVPQQLQPWLPGDTPLRAAVSSFGIGGSNAHAILEAPPLTTVPDDSGQPLQLLLSARSLHGLRALAQQHLLRLSDREAGFDAHAYGATSFYHRTLFSHRLLLSASDIDGWIGLLLDITEQDLHLQAAESGISTAVFSNGTEIAGTLLNQLVQATPAWSGLIMPPARRALLPVTPFDGERCWQETQNAAPQPADSWQALCQRAQQTASERGAELDLALLDEEDRCIDALHQHYVSQMLQQMQLLQQPQQFLNVTQLMQAASIPARYSDLMQRLLRDLVACGALQQRQQDGELWYGELRPASVDAEDWLERMRAAGYQHLAQLIARTGPQLGAMLRGDIDPVSVVFPAASTTDVEHMYQEQPWSRYFNQIAAQAMAALAQHSAQPLAILEIGGGTGGTTQDLLRALPDGKCEHYSFTDLGTLFLQRARDKFAAYPFIDYLPFDMEQPASQQGLPRQQYDAIVAANVLHNAADLRQMLRNLASVLKPGGVLLMREITAPKKLFDFVFGALVPPIGDTALRHGELFASQQDWQSALHDAGFVQCTACPAAYQPAAALGEQIIMARVADETTALPAAAARQITLAASSSDQALLDAAYQALSADTPCRLSQVVWHCDPQGASDPLTITLSLQQQQLEAFIGETPLFSARFAPARVAGVEASPRTGWLPQPWRQHGALYHWQWHPVALPQPDAACRWQPLTITNDPAAQPALFNQLQQLLASGDDLLLTAGGMLHHTGDQHAASWLPGLLAVARHEYPRSRIALIDTQGLTAPLDQLLCQRLLACEADQLRWQDSSWHSPRLTRTTLSTATVSREGCHLLTGGLSPLGLALAGQLADQGASKLIFFARRAPHPHQLAQLDTLRQRGIEVVIDSAVDMADETSLNQALERLMEQQLPIATLWHLAGVVNDAPLAQLSWSTLQQTLATRLRSAQLLDRWQSRLQPAQTVYFSSAATLFGPQGQAAHAAACGALENLARQRCARGEDTLAVAWGYWQITESAAPQLAERIAAGGMAALNTDTALRLLQAARAAIQPVVAAMDVDWQILAASQPDTGDRWRFAPFLTSVAAATQTSTPEQPQEALQLEHYLRETLARQLNCPPELISADSNLVQLGLDSLLFLDLNETLGRDLGVKLNAENVFRAASVKELIAALQQEMVQQPESVSLLRQALDELEATQPGWLDPRGDIARQAPASTALPLTPLQRLRWQQHPHSPRLLYVEYDKPHDFPLEAFEQGWQRLLTRHPMLRAAITAEGNIAVAQQIPALTMQRHPWRELTPDALLERQLALRETLSQHQFDLQQPPQIVLAVSDSAQGYRLHLVLNTLLVDIESFRVLLRELDSAIHHPDTPLPQLAFSPQDYHHSLLALAQTQAAHYPQARLPASPALPWQTRTTPAEFAIWRAALPAEQWLPLKQAAEQQGISGTDLLLAAWGLVLRDWSATDAFTLRLDFTDRLPLHPHASQLIADATTVAPVPLDLRAASSFAALAQQVAQQRQQHLARHLPGGAVESSWQQSLPVAFTSLLGVRQAYSIAETSDPLLGMPAYEYAAQPLTPLHLQALEEESALLFNIDLQRGVLPEELGEIALMTLHQLLETLSAVTEAWQAPLNELLPVDTQVVALAQQASGEAP